MKAGILKVQLWSLFRLTRLEIFVRILAPIVLLFAFKLDSGNVIYFVGTILLQLLLLSSLTSLLWLKSFEQHSREAFPLSLGFVGPLSDVWLAALPLAWLLVTNTLVYLTLATVAQFILGYPFPTISMLPFIAIATSAIAMIAWSSVRSVERIAGALFLGYLAVVWFRGKLDALDPLAIIPLDWSSTFHTSTSEWLLGFGGAVIFSALSILSVSRQRHGDNEPFLGWRRLFANSFAERLERRTGFASVRSAQLWFELRKVGFRGVAITVVAIFMLAAGVSSAAREYDLLGALLFYSGLFFAPLVLMVAVVEGVLGLRYRGHSPRLSPYEATLPLNEANSILLKTEVAFGVTLIGWLVLGLTLLLGVFGSLDSNIPSQSPTRLVADLANDEGNIALWIAVGFALLLALSAAMVLAITALGYLLPRIREHAILAYTAVLCALIPIPVDIAGDLLVLDLQPILDIWLITWGLFLLGVAVVSLRTLRVQGHCRATFLWGCTFCWTVLLALALKLALEAEFNPVHLATRPAITIFVVGLLSIPLASVAWAPLSLAALRHQ